jgi:ornithine carbamoyltransferase
LADVGTPPELKHVNTLRGRSIVGIIDLTRDDLDLIFSITSLLKETDSSDPTAHQSMLPGRTLAMIFEKPSLRTRVTFEVGMTQLGGHAIYLAPSDIQLGVRETIADAARNLSRWCDVIMARVFAHSTVTELAEHASIPVINGLSDLEHPCQALADFYTIREKKRDVKGLKLAYIGDGNNVANSLMLLAAKLGTHFTIACPEGYEPNAGVTAEAREIAKETGSSIEIVRNPPEAADGADVLYADVWASMGQESEREERKKVFKKYQINQKLLSKAKPDAIVLHCLPAHRGEEITDEVIDGPQSAVLDESENRLHVQKAVLALVV